MPETLDQPGNDTFVEALHDVLVHLHDQTVLQSHPFATIAVDARDRRNRRKGRGNLSDRMSPEIPGAVLAQDIYDALISLQPRTPRPSDRQVPSVLPLRADGVDPSGAPLPAHHTEPPSPDATKRSSPVVARAHRRAEALRLRYVDGLPVATIQARLNISRSEYFRKHREGLDALASILRRRWGTEAVNAFVARTAGVDAHEGPMIASTVKNAGRLHVPTRFIGRETDLAILKDVVQSAPLTTIVGPPGAGKTRLAIELARHVRESFPDGVVVVTLAELTDESLVLPAIARSVGLFDVPATDLSSALANFLAGQRRLLILDNFEHVIGASKDVSHLVSNAPDVAVLVTSRAPLGVASEQRYPLEPLPVPAAGTTDGDSAPIQTNPAVQLFIDRARAIEPGFPATTQDLDATVAICRLLDGLPLAIELAAARLGSLTAPTILSRLTERPDERLSLLRTVSRDRIARHQTLRHAIQWSQSLLHPTEVRLLGDMSVFVVGASLDAILAIVSPVSAGLPPPSAGRLPQDGRGLSAMRPVLEAPSSVDVLNRLGSLVENSLVRRQSFPDGETRFTMLETIRAYGMELLKARGGTGDIRRRHASYYSRLAAEVAPAMRGIVADQLLKRLDAELPNIREALQFLSESGEVADALSLLVHLEYFWWLQGYRLEGLTWLRRLLEANGQRISQTEIAGDQLASALTMAGHLCALSGDDVGAGGYLADAITLARVHGPVRSELDALHHLAVLARARGDDDRASEYWIDVSRRAGANKLTYRQGISFWHLGFLACDRLDYVSATQWLSEGRSVFDANAMPIGRALVQITEGAAEMIAGNFLVARGLIEGSIRDLTTYGSSTGVMYATGTLAELEFLEGNAALALDAAERSSYQMRQLGQERGMSRNLITLGHAAIGVGDYSRARRAYLDALRRSLPAERLPVIGAAMLGIASLTSGTQEADRQKWALPTNLPTSRTCLAAAQVLYRTVRRPLALVERKHAKDTGLVFPDPASAPVTPTPAPWFTEGDPLRSGASFDDHPLPDLKTVLTLARSLAATIGQRGTV